MRDFACRFVRDQRGATAIEYCLIAGLMALAVVGGLSLIGTRLEGLFQQVRNSFP